jgi:hypothetical protein
MKYKCLKIEGGTTVWEPISFIAYCLGKLFGKWVATETDWQKLNEVKHEDKTKD